ncbi:MAG: AAA family ATPase, partial [Elusimicrobia bacterium]|nr:AAA family ATPase [Elusimicrobiota bacterium]
MLAQWVSWVYREGYQSAWREPFIKLGSAPLASAEFRSAVLGQLGEPRLETAIGVDLAGPQAHASVLDADTKGVLQGIHRRVGTAILFESSGGHVDRVAHLPELRFALLEPGIDTTSIDSAASALEAKAFFISRVGTDGYKIYHKATLRKAVSDRKASLDDDEVRDAAQALVREEFKQGAAVPVQPFPQDGAAVPDSPRLTLVVVDPGVEWTPATRSQIAEWTLRRGQSPRLYPGALMWCVRKPGRELRDKVEVWLAWKRVAKEVAEGTLGSDFDRVDRAEVEARAREAESAAKDEVWATYRFVALAESGEPDGLKVLDLGAGHSSGRESLSARVISALKNEGLLNETVSAGYLERKWPAALKQSGAWPLSGLRQCFLNGTLPRLLDPDGTLTGKIAEFVGLGEFGLASGSGGAGGFARLWFKEPLNPDEISFESDVFLLTKQRAEQLAAGVVVTQPSAAEAIGAGPNSGSEKIAPEESGETIVAPVATKSAVRIRGQIPPEVWNRLGTKLLPRLKQGTELKVSVQFEVQIDGKAAGPLREEVSQVISDLGLNGSLRIEP